MKEIASKIVRIMSVQATIVLLCTCTFVLLCTVAFAQTSITSNLPIVVISSHGQVIPNEYKVPASFKISAPGGGGLHSYDVNLATNSFQFEGDINIEIRGASTTLWPKLPYGFEVVDQATGDNMDVSLLGMPEESDWILLASYGDKTFIRDVLSHHLFTQTGRYSPKGQYVELYLKENGSMAYQGIYILIEKIKRGSNRVNIKKLEEEDTDAQKATGGYIVQLGENEDLKWYSSISGNDVSAAAPKPLFHVEYPKLHKYTNIPNRDQQFNYIKGYVDNFEQALNGPDYTDAALGYRSTLEVDAMIDYFLMQELTKNSDAWRFSTFFYKNRDSEGGKLVMGPIWDFDRALGNFQWWCNAASVQPTDWAWKFNLYCPDDNVVTAFWPKKLLSDCYFSQKLISRYQYLRQNQWSSGQINDFIDAQRATLTSNNAVSRNFSRWDILHTDVIHNPSYPVIGNTYDKEVEYLKNWIGSRLAWMDANIAAIGTNTEPCATLPVTYNHFHAKSVERSVLLSWSTSMELNNKHFEIERSADAKRFEKIGVVAGIGNSNSEINYEFADYEPFQGTRYYRIRQVDEDGSYQLTSIRAVKSASYKDESTTPHPNPSSDYVSIPGLIPNSTVQILDVKGNIIQTIHGQSPTSRISLKDLQSGLYIVRATNGNQSQSYRVAVSR
jgi:hypothetical protein